MIIVMIATSIVVGFLCTIGLYIDGYDLMHAVLIGYVGGGMASMILAAVGVAALRIARGRPDWSKGQQPVHRSTTPKV